MNLFDLGIVLSVAFLLAALSSLHLGAAITSRGLRANNARTIYIQPGQTVLVSGAVGSAGRAAVWTAKKAGAVVIAGVKKSQLKEAAALGADQVLALDDVAAMEKLGFIDAVADTVGGGTAEMLLGKVKQGGVFASVLGAPGNAKMHPTVKVEAVRAEPDVRTLRTMAEDVAAGHFVIPIDRMVSLAEAGAAQAAAEKGGIGKILLLA